MKRLTLFLVLAFLVWGVPAGRSQETSVITMQNNSQNNGVLVLTIRADGKTFRLTCNQGMPGCVSLKGRTYQMVKLPKNFGMYECQNVEIYAASDKEPSQESKVGTYCLED